MLGTPSLVYKPRVLNYVISDLAWGKLEALFDLPIHDDVEIVYETLPGDVLDRYERKRKPHTAGISKALNDLPQCVDTWRLVKLIPETQPQPTRPHGLKLSEEAVIYFTYHAAQLKLPQYMPRKDTTTTLCAAFIEAIGQRAVVPVRTPGPKQLTYDQLTNHQRLLVDAGLDPFTQEVRPLRGTIFDRWSN